MCRDPLVLDVFSLSYWEGLDFYGFSICCGTPQAIGIFLRNKIGDSTWVIYTPTGQVLSSGGVCV